MVARHAAAGWGGSIRQVTPPHAHRRLKSDDTTWHRRNWTDLLPRSVIEDMSSRTSGYSSGVRSQRYPGGQYQGKWLGQQPHGFGVKQTSSGLVYEGHWQKGQRHGIGSLRRKQLDGRMERIYVGQWRENKRSGEGKQFYPDGSVYFGQWLADQRSGEGILWQADGGIYVGEWLRDKMHEKGLLFTGECDKEIRYVPLDVFVSFYLFFRNFKNA